MASPVTQEWLHKKHERFTYKYAIKEGVKGSLIVGTAGLGLIALGNKYCM
jgi:hypothetical protein